MLINTKLPLSLDYLQKQDQTFSLSGMTWTDYEKFNSEEYLGFAEKVSPKFMPLLTKNFLTNQ
ncbi:general secretion pathway protein GspE [Crocosphaera watsonii]|uniref:General secretion pathway protein E / Type II secretory pathway, ATPase PulE/Tfp pilus assembly pathway, ATPase PilB n=1 Tax=Crocosphaera watsonii WH 8502 TaxID=423474 RepID=T2ICR3_CROWT|nr:general secretion pathway protein GspE [Crocosphaera watsonii]CCQ50035.1 General secretion pathway protein E / Type II secretory pathway, ATPase PulE/Tfp pilus assembly pathway, ATPase PilB [Crocosphaera watsonii WH 8502]